MVDYFIRMPYFPIIGIFDDILLTAESDLDFIQQLNRIWPVKPGKYTLIDSTGNVWIFKSEDMMVHAFFFEKNWTKIKLIRFYNSSQYAIVNGGKYSENSLSSKRFEKIFNDLVSLISKANQTLLNKQKNEMEH